LTRSIARGEIARFSGLANADFPCSFGARQLNGLWRSLVARLHGVQEAVGSNPASPTIHGNGFLFSDISPHRETLQLTGEGLVGENFRAQREFECGGSFATHLGIGEAARWHGPQVNPARSPGNGDGFSHLRHLEVVGRPLDAFR
jgi:hypothetical protein